MNIQPIRNETDHLAALRELSRYFDNPPKPVKEGVSKEEAEQVKAKLEEQGATVELK